MSYSAWRIDGLRFTGRVDIGADLRLGPGLSLVYGASNTGKSFALKAIDFMLGGKRELPNIKERQPYNRLWLEIAFSKDRRVSLERSLVGGAFTLREANAPPRVLAPTHDTKSQNNLSVFLLDEMGVAGRKVAIDGSGTQSNLSFRDIAALVLADEVAIQSEDSPIESGDSNLRTRERSVFKFVLTGEDDSAIIPVVRPREFRTSRAAKASLLHDLIGQLESDIANAYPDADGLNEREERIDQELRRLEGEIVSSRSSIRSLLDEKRSLSFEISSADRRSEEVALSLESFQQLEAVYASDISRLESIEEVGFLLALDGSKSCPVCGAQPEFQVHSHGLASIESIRLAAEVEIQKIEQQRLELRKTVDFTKAEQLKLDGKVGKLRKALRDVEQKIEAATPGANEQQRALAEVLTARDSVQRGLELVAQRSRLVKQRDDIERSKAPKRSAAVQRGLSTETARDFAAVVSSVLAAWGFPGRRQVVLDLSSYDLIIDGKERRNNGKGVRAITHAAFKVALMLFCQQRALPHPGFLVLDTPLLTYRDPMKRPGDSLTEDERELRNTDLKASFFDHLGHLPGGAQVIVLENVDPPPGAEVYAKVEAFTNDPSQGRQGLL